MVGRQAVGSGAFRGRSGFLVAALVMALSGSARAQNSDAQIMAHKFSDEAQSAPSSTPSAAEAARIIEQRRLETVRAGQDRAAPFDKSLEQVREDELRALSERIRQREQKRAAEILKTAAPEVATADDVRGSGGRAAVLMVMSPGTFGIRRFVKSADPVLCIGDHCYVSEGSVRDARAMTRSLALGMGNTLGKRAEACNHKLACVFRNVEIGAVADVEPVDLHILKHDHREMRSVRLDGSCRMVRGRLTCGRAIHAQTYTLWVVPEEMAQTLSPGVMDTALESGLTAVQTASAGSP